LDEIEGRAPPTALPRILGHQVVGRVVGRGAGVPPREGSRVGVAWIFGACGSCEWCQSGAENLCPRFVATGRDVDGGYAELMVAPADFVHPLPRSEEHTSELQSRENLVCRLLLEKKKKSQRRARA